MISPYAVLGVSPKDNDETIRQKYLALIREFTPERHPERFAEIRKAFELIGTLANRAEYHLHRQVKEASLDDFLKELRCRTPTARVTLDQLLTTVFPPS